MTRGSRWLLWAGVLALATVAAAEASAGESTLAKIGRSGTLTVGTRTGSPPFGFIDKSGQWVGFSVDLARLVHQRVQKTLGKAVRFELKESTPATRIALLESGAVDLIAGTMTVTRSRRERVDFSLVYFVTGAQFLVRKGSPLRNLRDVAGRRIGVQMGSTSERALRERFPQAQVVTFPDQPAAFAALARGQLDAYTNDGVQLAGLRAKAPSPGDFEVVGEPYTYEPYGMAMRRDDGAFRQLVDVTLMEAIEGGEYQRLYDRWFGPKGDVPYPLPESVRIFMQMQVLPR